VREVQTLGASGEKPRTLVVGCGGAGCNAIGVGAEDPGLDFLAVNDLPHRAFAVIKRRMLLPKEGLRGVAALDEKAVNTLATTSEQMLAMELGDAELVVPVAGLGGEMGGWGAGLVARVAGIRGATTLAVVMTPFSAEGVNRRTAASGALAVLRQHAHGVLALPNDALLRVAPHLPVLRAFEMMSRIAMQTVRDLVQVVTREDLPMLQAVLRNATGWSLGIGDGFHDRPGLAAVDAAFRSPWLAGPGKEASEVIVLMRLPMPDDRAIRDVLHDVDLRTPRAAVTWGAFPSPDPEAARVTVLLGH
jgi:cell division protein FtsZ